MKKPTSAPIAGRGKLNNLEAGVIELLFEFGGDSFMCLLLFN